VPAPGDYDGSGAAEAAVYRPDAGQWWVHDASGGRVHATFGLAEDIPVPGVNPR
jgi:hypothetical protein